MSAEKFQRLLTHIPMDHEDVDPEEPDGVLIGNIIRRVWATLMVQSGQEMVRVQGSPTGGLKVDDDAAQAQLVLILAALVGGLTVEAEAQIPNIGESWEGTLAADAWTGYTAFTAESRVVTCTCETHPCWFQLADPGTGYSVTFFLPADTGRSMNIRTKSFRVKNYGAGNNAKWQVINDYLA